ncbi:MAG: hypothetical protein ABR587_10810 [Candidatus Binatia bacterium]
MRLPIVVASAILLVLAAGAAPASAQHPVCAPPAAGEVMKTSCRSWAAPAMLRLLDDFTIDQIFKPVSFERTWSSLMSAFASKDIPENEAFRATARSLEPIRFTPLDRTTGTLLSDLSGSPRSIDVRPDAFGGPVSVHVELPELLEGGYWRGPDSVQLAFWKRSRVAVQIRFEDTEVARGKVQCVALSPEGLLVRFAEEASTPIFLQIRDCRP